VAMNNPPHPGLTIRNIIEELDVSITGAAIALGVNRQTLNNLVNQHNGVSPEMALRLETVFGSTADAWLQMQVSYDISKVRTTQNKITKGLQKLQSAIGR
jgi:addiction module HigA family antidote